ncbi:hypothetical protein [Nocardioides panzhihuensis]|uniref:Uncharacterized protein n=1 Tax=Nocardioides panzhihuensis TaxID=860243 RepID=A0A7Z0DJL5_9ACTN|nr:hypothetical protein [Nocardioides panzhihuensis]NYI76629.1 hypothetical protein [Nocardioides panzhihuensis]
MARLTFTDPDALGAHLGARLAARYLHGEITLEEIEGQILLDIQDIHSCESGKPIVVAS